MAEPCVQIDQLAAILDLEESDPRRQHVDQCPRCRALMASYRDFMRDRPELVEAEIHHRLGEILTHEILEQPLEDARTERSDEPVTRPGLLESAAAFLRHLTRPAVLRPALPAVAVLVIGMLLVQPWNSDHERGIVLRGGESAAPGGIVSLLPIRPVNGGGLVLSWRGVPEADAYRVAIISGTLTELSTVDTGIDTSLVLGAAERTALSEGTQTLFWRVQALSNGDVIAHSRPGSIPPTGP